MATGKAVRKRRVLTSCPNPLFVKWVEELRDEAVEKGAKSQYSYSKALSSIRRYPLPLSSGQEAKLLDHVGEKLAKIFDKKLKEREANTPDSTSPLNKKPKSTNKRKKSPADGVCAETDAKSCSDISPPKSKRRRSAPREYIPVYRSGPYALVIALHQAEQKPSWCGYLKKNELIAEAQPQSDSSFTVADAGSYYTAWSSMSILVEKGLVIRHSHPPKFKLSEKGVSMAVKLLQGNDLTSQSSVGRTDHSQSSVGRTDHSQSSAGQTDHSQSSAGRTDHSQSSAGRTDHSQSSAGRTDHSQSSAGRTDSTRETKTQEKLKPRKKNKSYEPEDAKKKEIQRSFVPSPPSSLIIPDSPPPSSTSTSSYELDELDNECLPSSTKPKRRLMFWYIDPNGCHVNSKDEAAVTFNTELSVGFLIKCKRQDLEESTFRYNIDHVRDPDGDFVYAYLSNYQGPDFSNPPPATSALTDHISTISETPLTNKTYSAKSRICNAPVLITLSDSESECDVDCSVISDDLDIVKPLAERVGLVKNITETSSSLFKQDSSKLLSPAADMMLEDRSACMSTPGKGLSPEGKTFTPAQVAGRAALKRLGASQNCPSGNVSNDSGKSSKGRSSSTKYQMASNPVIETVTKAPHRPLNSVPKELKCTNSLVVDLTGPSKVDNTQGSRVTNTLAGQSSSTAKSKDQRSSSNEETVDLSCPEFILRPGDYDVILCVDSAESTASRKQSSQFRGLLLQELGKNGVQFDVRKLNVGDFLWIGREKVSPAPGQLSLPSSREVVLEYIVERKRMDDLEGSITDGRFKEQKFRLKSCGVIHPIYLVEEYRDMCHLKLPLRSLNQAVANTQVLDDFYVKRTTDIRESIAYLTVMTRQLQKYYSDKTLKAYSYETITELVKTRKGQSSPLGHIVHSMPFKMFNEASIKNKVLSVYEMFGRHLMQLPNFSADKALAVLELYPTVSLLRQAYRDCSNASERAKLLSNVKAGKAKRRLGDVLSSLVYSLYWIGKDV